MTILVVEEPVGFNMAGFGRLALAPPNATVFTATSSLYSVPDYGWTANKFYGSGLTYDDTGHLTGGVVTSWEAWGPGWDEPWDGRLFTFEGLSIPATTVAGWLVNKDGPESDARLILLGGDDSIVGGGKADYLQGFAGNDTISGGAGDDVIVGGSLSDDTTHPDALQDGSNYLRGGDGNDNIQSGAGFDDINGNQGNDTCWGGGGDDWVVGGQGDDLLHGDWPDSQGVVEGDDIVLGNLGNDTCSGDGGKDTVRGGQGDDSLSGGAGDDWLSGDRGNDTMGGGGGADIFHTFGEAGIDRVTDFNPGEGDRVMLDTGSTYTVAQAGADTVITLGGGAQMILVGVQLSTLGGDWIFAG
jgi:Ca2+-binding RTX toxin-like protein